MGLPIRTSVGTAHRRNHKIHRGAIGAATSSPILKVTIPVDVDVLVLTVALDGSWSVNKLILEISRSNQRAPKVMNCVLPFVTNLQSAKSGHKYMNCPAGCF